MHRRQLIVKTRINSPTDSLTLISQKMSSSTTIKSHTGHLNYSFIFEPRAFISLSIAKLWLILGFFEVPAKRI